MTQVLRKKKQYTNIAVSHDSLYNITLVTTHKYCTWGKKHLNFLRTIGRYRPTWPTSGEIAERQIQMTEIVLLNSHENISVIHHLKA